MAAPQQSAIPTYKETASIPSARVDYEKFDERDTPGYALAKLLGAIPGAAERYDEKANKEPSTEEQEQLAALAEMGAERDRLRLAKGTSFFGLMSSDEVSMDSYDINRGRRDADLAAGVLRDAYANSGLADSDDPKAWENFVQQQQQELFKKLEGSTPSYYHGYITRMGGVFKDMATAHAGNLDTFVTHKNKRAFESRLESKIGVELAVAKERGAFTTFMDAIMGAESGGNYNAYWGAGGNQSIRFTDMTLDEVMSWQKQQIAKGKPSVAVGKYQFVSGTLKEVVREMGLDPKTTKFTPAIQDQMIFHRLVKTRGFMDYLDGKISAEDFLDKGVGKGGLAAEFAGLKKTSGRGEYDNDGLNRATLSASKTLAALKQLKEAYIRDPASVVKKDESGNIVVNGDVLNDSDDVATNLENAESEFGIKQSLARSTAADTLIRQMEANPTVADREDLEDLMSRWKVSKADRARVMEARDRLRYEKSQKELIAEQEATKAILGDADKFIRTGDQEALQTIRSKNPQVYQKLLELQTTPVNPDNLDNEGFLESAAVGTADFAEDALGAYASGKIDKATYTAVMDDHRVRTDAKPILSMPAIKPVLSKLRNMIPDTATQDVFDAQLAYEVYELTKANNGQRPSIQVIQQTAQTIQQSLLALTAQDNQTRLGRSDYQNLGNS